MMESFNLRIEILLIESQAVSDAYSHIAEVSISELRFF